MGVVWIENIREKTRNKTHKHLLSNHSFIQQNRHTNRYIFLLKCGPSFTQAEMMCEHDISSRKNHLPTFLRSAFCFLTLQFSFSWHFPPFDWRVEYTSFKHADTNTQTQSIFILTDSVKLRYAFVTHTHTMVVEEQLTNKNNSKKHEKRVNKNMVHY